MSTEPRTSVDALLSRLDRVRSLARRLVRDAAEADDLVHDAVAAALSRPTTVHGDGDGWIAATLRNLARDRARSTGRRDRRERATAVAEGAGHDASVLVENAERQRDVVEAVLALEDPYRETLLMRFFEDLPPREIVKRTGRSADAVKKHLDRGLAQVRAKLESRYGDRGAWAVALLPMVGQDVLSRLGATAAGAASATAGAAKSAAVIVRLAALLLVGLGVGIPSYLLWRGPERAAGASEDVELVRRDADEVAPALASVEAVDEGRDEALVVVPHDDGAHGDGGTLIAAPAFVVERRVRLLDLDGGPLANSWFEWTWSPSRGVAPQSGVPQSPHVVSGRTDDDGRATLRGPTHPSVEVGPWRFDSRELAAVGEVRLAGESVLVLAPAVRLAGRIVDADGAPFAGATVTIWSDVRALKGFVSELDVQPNARSTRRTSDAAGHFEFEAVPTDPAFRMEVSAEGRRDVEVPFPSRDDISMEIAVGRELPQGRYLTGTVLDADGSPAVGAAVRFLYHEAQADAQGRFRVQVPFRPGTELVSAEAEDGRFAVARSPVDTEDPQPSDRDGVVAEEIVLRLPAQMQALRGRLQDAEGRPVEGSSVLVFDGTRVGSSSANFETGGFGPGIVTDAGGRFVIDRAADRAYTLRFLDRASMVVHDVGPLLPGPTDHVITLPADSTVDALRGRVVDVFGEPLVGAEVALRTDLNPSTDSSVSHVSGRATTTDAEGRFAIANAPWRHLSLVVRHGPPDRSGSVAIPLGATMPTEPLELKVDLQCSIELTVGDEDARLVRAFDAEGERLVVRIHQSGMTTIHTRVSRSPSGSFPLFEVSQRAATLVFYSTDRELDRHPIRLHPAEPNEIDL